MSLQSIDKIIIATYSSFCLSYIFLLWLIRKQYPLQYCALNPISRYALFFYIWISISLAINGFLFEAITADSFRVILITYLVLNAIMICLMILKHKQILRSPRFEFRKLKQQDLDSMLAEIDRFMKEKSSEISKHDEFEIGYKNFYYYYEWHKEPFLYMEYNQANQFAGVNLEFYPSKEFNLMTIQQLMKSLYRSYGKNILAPYSTNRTKYFVIAVISLVVITIAGLVISFNSIWIYSSMVYAYIINNSLFAVPLIFLFLDVLRKTDKSSFLDNHF